MVGANQVEPDGLFQVEAINSTLGFGFNENTAS